VGKLTNFTFDPTVFRQIMIEKHRLQIFLEEILRFKMIC